MSIQSKMECWEIIQCKKEQKCHFAKNENKACWELAGDNDLYAYDICVDCLVYIAKHEDGILTEREFASIMDQRKKHILFPYETPPAQTFFCPASKTKVSLKSSFSPPRQGITG